MVKNASGKEGLRSFTIVNIAKHGGCKTKFHAGRYLSRTPAAAARKAFNAHCRTKRIRGVCTLVVTMKETTKDSKKKMYSYKLNRRKLKEPVIRLEGQPGEYVVEYNSSIKSVNVPENCKKPGQTRGRKLKRTIKRNKLRANNVRRMKSKVARKVNNKNNNKSKSVLNKVTNMIKKVTSYKNSSKNTNNTNNNNKRRKSPRLTKKPRVNYKQ